MRRQPPHILALAIAASLYTSCAGGAADKTDRCRAALDSIQATDLFEHVRILAEPAMEGREAGSAGGHAAADYVAKQFEHLHLRPAGTANTFFQPFDTEKVSQLRNVLALLPGSDPKLRDEVIVIGAHYDHLGQGGGRVPVGPLYPGAEDNASGVSTVLELAEAFSKLDIAPKRSILFACWDGEEKGLLGSKHFVSQPTIPLDRIVVKLNYDMVGQLKDDRLLLHCSRSGYGWRRLLSSNNDDPNPVRLAFTWDYVKNSDHHPFCQKNIPSLFAITDSQSYAHSPRDTADRINKEGMLRVTRWSFKVLCDLAERSTVPKFRAAALKETSANEKALFARTAQPSERFGIVVTDPAQPTDGVRVVVVKSGAPAEQAGIRTDDQIIRFGDREIHNHQDLLGAVYAASNPASLMIQRPGKEKPLALRVNLQGNPISWSMAGEVDDAEPGVLVLTCVVPGSMAARAGLQIGDRVYKINGQDFLDEGDFVGKLGRLRRPLHLTVEREGRVTTVTLQARPAPPAKRAA